MNTESESLFESLLDIPLSDIFGVLTKTFQNRSITLRDFNELDFESLFDFLAFNIRNLYNENIKEQDNNAYIEFIESLNNLGLNDISVQIADFVVFILKGLVNAYLMNHETFMGELNKTFAFVHQEMALCPLMRISVVKDLDLDTTH